jgi:hypothetical protein
MIPAIRATPRTSPFFSWLERIRGRAVGFEKRIEQMATAVRLVMALEDIGTMWAEPVGVRCVRFGVEVDGWEAGFAGFGVGGDEGGADFVE